MNQFEKSNRLKERVAELEKQIKETKEIIEFKKNNIKSESLFWQKVINKIPTPVYFTTSSRILLYNNDVIKSFGCSQFEMEPERSGEPILNKLCGKLCLLKKVSDELLSKNEGRLFEYRLEDSRGERHWYLVSVSSLNLPEEIYDLEHYGDFSGWESISSRIPDYSPDTNSSKYLVVLVCIDNRKKMEAQLNENEMKYKTLISNLFDIFIIAKNDKIALINDAAAKALGYSHEEIAHLQLNELFSDNYILNLQAAITEYAPDIFYNYGEVEIITKGNERKRVELKIANTIYDDDPHTIYLLTDLSAGRNSREYRYYSNRLLMVQEEERRRISRELHDNILQLLMSSLSTLEFCINSTGIDLPNEGEKIRDIVEKAVIEIRRISHDLHPIILEDLGLKPAINKMMREFSQKSGILIDAKLDISPDILSHEMNIGVYRILQDIFSYIANHKKTEEIVLKCSSIDSMVQITVQDKRENFDAEKFKANSFDIMNTALKNIRERVSLLNGEFKVIMGQGVKLTSTIEARL